MLNVTCNIDSMSSAEGYLPHILIPSLRERVRERLHRGGVGPPENMLYALKIQQASIF